MNHRIMVVDDELLLAEALCELLKIYGYEARYAVNGRQALEMFAGYQPDLVITDFIMPEMDGLQLLSEIKSQFPYIGVIMLTAYGSIENSIAALKQGAFDYITKPCKKEEIIQCLQRYFEQVRLHEENISLRQLNELKDKFLCLASHELNTPLMIVTGYLEMIKEVGTLQGSIRKYVIGAYNACSRLEKIIKGMRLLTRGKSDLNLEPVELNNWLQQSLGFYATIIQSRNQCLHQQLADTPVYIKADRNALQEIFDNLLSNAIKYTPDGGDITVGIAYSDSDARLFCKDNGDGISETVISRIFESFYTGTPLLQHHTALNYEYLGGGIGNGLAIVHHLTKIQNGKISVISRPGKGSHFMVSFPLLLEDEA